MLPKWLKQIANGLLGRNPVQNERRANLLKGTMACVFLFQCFAFGFDTLYLILAPFVRCMMLAIGSYIFQFCDTHWNHESIWRILKTILSERFAFVKEETPFRRVEMWWKENVVATYISQLYSRLWDKNRQTDEWANESLCYIISHFHLSQPF